MTRASPPRAAFSLGFCEVEEGASPRFPPDSPLLHPPFWPRFTPFFGLGHPCFTPLFGPGFDHPCEKRRPRLAGEPPSKLLPDSVYDWPVVDRSQVIIFWMQQQTDWLTSRQEGLRVGTARWARSFQPTQAPPSCKIYPLDRLCRARQLENIST